MPNAVSLNTAAAVLQQHGLVLPRRSLLRAVTSERDDLLNRLARIGVLIPGIENVTDLVRLRDIVQWQEDRTLERVKESLWAPDPKPKLRRKDQLTGIREYWNRKVIPQRENRKYLYQGSGVTALGVSPETVA